MCLLVARLSDSSWIPSPKELDNAWDSNPHGFGVGWIASDGVLYTSKTLQKSDVPAMLERIPDGSPAIMHWRFATHGAKSVANCHPFPCFNGEWIGGHNGVLSMQPLIDDLTDSESFLRSLKGDRPNIPQVEARIRKLGYGKMVFLSRRGSVLIANEQEGDWRLKGEVWQSNHAFDQAACTGLGFGSRSFFGRNSDWWQNWDENEYVSQKLESESPCVSRASGRLTRVTCDWCSSNQVAFMVEEDGSLICESCAEML